MRGYVALNGRDGAFGWGRRGGDGEYALTFSGLASGKEYMLSSGETIMADSSGMWHGKRKEMPLFAAADGKVILCDESSFGWEEAALRIAPEKKKTAYQGTQAEIRKTSEKTITVYRTHLNGEGVDTLPAAAWPKGCEEIRICMEKSMPTRVLPYPWRFTIVPGTNGQCMVGRLLENGRITKTAAAVRAKGGLMQPKGLRGYDYVRTDTGEAYWMLIRSVR